jgi:glycosyltransferase involved in cell wall biosynthesis
MDMSDNEPDLSVVVPAYNEAEYLPDTLRTLNESIESVEERVEIIVVDNNSTDDTAEIARNHGAEVVFEPHNQIARARNRGAEEARGEWLLFLDADTLMPADLLESILERRRDPDVIGGGACLTFQGDAPRSAYWGLEVWNWISRTFRMAAGSVIWCRRAAFEVVGGFDESVYASEEIWLSRALKKRAKTLGQHFEIIESPRARTSPRKFNEFSTLKLTAGFFMFLVAPWIIFSKRATRWYWYE